MIDDHDIILDEKETDIYLEDPYRIIPSINHSIWVVQVNITIHHDTNGIFTICNVISHHIVWNSASALVKHMGFPSFI